MKVAMLVAPDGTQTPFTADGPLGHNDSDRRVLHILPKLLVPSGVQQHLKRSDVVLEVESTLGIPMLRIEDIEIRQPYPNTRYYVAGSKTSRNGWVIDLPEGVETFDLTFKWEFFRPWTFSDYDELLIEHVIHVRLLRGENRTYTMDPACWPRGLASDESSGPLFKGNAVTLIGLDGDPDLQASTDRDIVSVKSVGYKNGDDEDNTWIGRIIEENLTIPPVAYEQVWSLMAFEEEQLHEVRQVSTFESFRDEHQANASVEMPPQLLLAAIQAAQDVPYYKSAFASCEKHPALVMLNEWWEANRQDDKPMRAGHAMPWVRVQDDDEYWCGNYDTPNLKIGEMSCFQQSAARVGESILLLYCAAAEHSTFPEDGGVQYYLTDGQKFVDVGVPKDHVLSGEYDEAWYALDALSRFPSRFPAAYAALQAAAEVNQA